MAKLVLNCFIACFLVYSFVAVHGDISCSQTPYPHVCNHYMRKYNTPSTSYTSSSSFHDMALRVTMDEAIESHKLLTTMNLNDSNERGAKAAMDDCLELYEDTINLLKSSVGSNNPNDRLTWLSASMANQQTCQNGFIEFNLSSHLNHFPIMLTNFSRLVSNSLAISKAMTSSSSSLFAEVGSRRLLSNGFPEWLSVSDRRLLQATVKADIVVAKDGSGNYRTISECLAAAAKMRSGSKRVIVHVKAGVYQEKIEIKKKIKNLMIFGDGIDATVITGSNNAIEGSTTFRSATFAVSGDGFIARDITFENTAGPQNHQAVALRSGADHSVFYRCSFKGYEDTLYVYSQRQFYRECDIHGTIDFIFGDAAAILQNCNIYVRKPMRNQFNIVTAQGRSDPNENTGIIIQKSRIMASGDLKPVQNSFKTFLGRPWRKYSRVVVMESYLDGLISPAGWSPWNKSSDLSTLYYGEYINNGPGGNTARRVNWPGFHVITSAAQAVKFTVGNFLDGDSWIPSTGVPFDAGL